jgi:transposase InsO family protein
VGRSITSSDVIGVLDRLIAERGAPAFIRSLGGPEFIAEAVREHLADLDVDTRFITPGVP